MSRLDTYIQTFEYDKIQSALEKLLQEESFCNAIDTFNFDIDSDSCDNPSIGTTSMLFFHNNYII